MFVSLALGLLSLTGASAQRQLTINAKPGAPIQPTMYGIFFEDINFGADGGLYAEMVENRSFEFPQRLMGWNTFGNVSVSDVKPAFDRNPHYVVLESAGHDQKFSGLENRGFFGMGLKKGMSYDFSVFARLHDLQGKEAKIRVELVDDQDKPIDKQEITITNNKWAKKTVTLTSNKTVEKGLMRIFLESADGVDLDHVSLFPADNWHGLRADLVKDLQDLHPGIFRFPGGCIVEGTDLATRYQWKNSVGPAENRPLNENRWNYTFPHRLYPNYYQTYGLGFYEFFLLSEKIGAEPLPVLSCGLACQFQNKDTDKNAHVAVDDLQPYIDDALDLIEFANGATTTKWGKLRAEMGHPQPFNLKQIGIGNEQWGPLYPERLKKFVEQIRAKYPNIKICGTSGPSASGKDFDYGWEQMRKPNEELQICSFLWIYYGFPTSSYEGINTESVRFSLGMQMGQQDDADVDCVCGIPSSGVGMALGYAEGKGVPYHRAISKYTPTWPRSFTPANQEMRNLVAKMKLIPNRSMLQDRKMVFCDDSIVRGTQLHDNVKTFYEYGAKEVHIRISCPPLIYSCPFVGYTASKGDLELLTRRIIKDVEGDPNAKLDKYATANTPEYNKMVEIMRQKFGLNTLKFNTVDNVVKAIGLPKCKICTHCFDGSSHF